MKNIKTYRKGELTLILDKDRVIKDNPGEDTPAMVYLMKNGKSVACATYWCAVNEGILSGSYDYELTNEQIEWLDNLEFYIEDFLYSHI